MRITILGLPGSGKSTLARKIAESHHIPYIHIDRFWLEGGGGHNSRTTIDPERARQNVRANVLEAVKSESWVSDGVYPRVQIEITKLADTIVFLDIPLWRRLLNHANRTIHRKNRHDEITFWGDIEFFREVVSRELRSKSKIEDLLRAYPEKVITLRSRAEIANYFKSLPTP